MDKGNLIWLDMEMSGLEPADCVPLEVATIVTDSELNILAEGPNLVISQPDSVLDGMDEWNTEHHGASGLTSAVRASTIDCKQAEMETLTFLRKWCVPGSSPLCGNTIGQDRRFIRKYMPELEEFLHYRVIDISSLKELCARWYKAKPPHKKECHRALDDIRESIEELRFYRTHYFVDHEGTEEDSSS